MLASKNKYWGKAYGKLMRLSADKEWRREYEARQKAIRDYNSMMNYNYEEGERVGYEQGRNSKLKELVQKKLVKQKTAEQIAEELEEDLSVIEEIIRSIK